MEYEVIKRLPNNGEIVLAYGYRTDCCALDMETTRDWHETRFLFLTSSYRLKKVVPSDPEESILEDYKGVEMWECIEDEPRGHVIGVTKWKKIK